jgi:PAS domain S-box-containing protein
MPESGRRRLIGYGVAVLAIAVTLLLRWLLRPVLGDAVPHMFFFPAILIAAYFGGLGPGLLNTLLGAIFANYFIAPAAVTQHIERAPAVALTLFMVVGVIISGLSESLHRARRRLVAHERQRAREALDQERSLLRALMDNVPDNIYFKDTASRFIQINKALSSYFGLSDPAQAVGKTDFDFFTAEHATPAYADEQEIMSTGQPVVGKEEKETWLDGRVRWVSTTKMPFRDKDGRITGTFGVARDITKLKLAEEALRVNEHRWRSLTEALPQLVWSATPDGACDYFSTQWTEHTGVPERELLGWRWLEVLHPDDREPTREIWTCSVCGCGPYDVEYRVRRSDGVYRWFKTRGVPIQDGAGNVVKWFGTCTDITELREAEDALRESEERFRGTFENAAVGIALADLEGRFVRVNQKYCEFTGYTCDELLEKTFRDITHPDDLTASSDRFAALMRGQSPSFNLKKRYLRKDGSSIWVELFISLQRDAAGSPAYAIAILQDISERKRLVGELIQAKEAAEAASRAKDEFLANVSHEIRTPMNAILGMTELALDTPLTEDQRQCLTTVKSAADNLLSIINDLLDFSKIEAGKLELAPTDFSLRAALGDTLRALAVRAHKKGLELVSQVQPDVHDALIGDAGRLRQVLLNLIGNAIKFTDDGEVVVRVEVVPLTPVRSPRRGEGEQVISRDSASMGGVGSEGSRGISPLALSGRGVGGEGGRGISHLAPSGRGVGGEGEVALRFAVRDTGIGIPKNKQEGIFRAFEQEDTSITRKYEGTGLGLTISSRLVALMGGQITVESEPGRGSTFAFTARFKLQPHPAEPATAQTPDLLHNVPVLIVDDNATNRHILREWLRRWQMVPVAVGDGAAAMDALRHGTACGRPYTLVLLDARMPEIDGLALASQIRNRAELSATRIILLTSGERPGDWDRTRELGIDARLLKPVQEDELLETIFRVVSRQTVSGRVVSGEWSKPSTATPHPSPLTSHSSPLTPHLSILVAEDNEFNAQLLEQLLVRRGHRVRLADNGREALALAKRGVFDLLLLDIHMPELDGFQVVEAVREHERAAGGHLPVVALTARARKEDRDRCIAAGMDDFLAKPIQAASLWATIDQVVDGRPEGEQTRQDLLDPGVLLAACGGDAAILEKICQTFVARLPDHLRAVQEAIAGSDAPRLRETAHRLCGMVSGFSTVAGGVASKLEDLAAENRLDEARPLVGQLDTMVQDLSRAVNGLSLENLHELLRPVGSRIQATSGALAARIGE